MVEKRGGLVRKGCERGLSCVSYHRVTVRGTFYHLDVRNSQDVPSVMVKGEILRVSVGIGIRRG